MREEREEKGRGVEVERRGIKTYLFNGLYVTTCLGSKEVVTQLVPFALECLELGYSLLLFSVCLRVVRGWRRGGNRGWYRCRLISRGQELKGSRRQVESAMVASNCVQSWFGLPSNSVCELFQLLLSLIIN
jgi:hypothetical protein